MQLSIPTCTVFCLFVLYQYVTINGDLNPYLYEENGEYYYRRAKSCDLRSLMNTYTSYSFYNQILGMALVNTACCFHQKTWSSCCLRAINNVQTCLCLRGTQCATGPSVPLIPPRVTTTTPAPTTTRRPTTTIGTPAPTTTISIPAPTTTTTPPPTTLCTNNNGRVLSSTPVNNQCTFNGFADIQDQTGAITICNAVYTSANVNGVQTETFATSEFCANVILQFQAANLVPQLRVGGTVINITPANFNTVVDAAQDSGFITPIPPVSIQNSFPTTAANCGSYVACSLSNVPVANRANVNFNNCQVISRGQTVVGTFPPSAAGVAVRQVPCTNVQIPLNTGETGNLCFTSTSGNNIYCTGDAGAPVYCASTSTNENILVGVTAVQNGCNQNPNIRAIQLP